MQHEQPWVGCGEGLVGGDGAPLLADEPLAPGVLLVQAHRLRALEEIRVALEEGDSVKLSGFGNFQLRDKPQRPGRNPKTGEEIPITARRVVTFHASQKLKGMVELKYANSHSL